MAREITAKVKLHTKIQQGDKSWALTFFPDYHDGKNKEWSHATPSLYIQMTVREDVGEKFDLQKSYTLTFTQEDEDGGDSTS